MGKGKRKRNRRKTQSPKPRQIAPEFMPGTIDVPLWEYSALAETASIQSQDGPDPMDYHEALEALLLVPVYIGWPGKAANWMIPLETIHQSNVSIDEFVASQLTLHELGLAQWDAATRTHLLTTPPAPN